MLVLERTYPHWRTLSIHESSPANRGASAVLRTEAAEYVETQYDTSLAPGRVHPALGYRSENLEEQTFDDARFDLVITQDVFEHVFHPDRAIREIVRTLKPGGAHIFTVPIVRKSEPSRRRASIEEGCIRHHLPPEYHGNPIDPTGGALVTIDWGYDILPYLQQHGNASVSMVTIDDLRYGIRAEFIDILLVQKLTAPVI